jgi:hypothetical protein
MTDARTDLNTFEFSFGADQDHNLRDNLIPLLGTLHCEALQGVVSVRIAN